jgi:3-oxoacyl-(acyl-carrier-protein) synthase
VVVTGQGVVSSLGHDPETFYNNLLAGTSGVSMIEGWDTCEERAAWELGAGCVSRHVFGHL